jgi:hypothetical protein
VRDPCPASSFSHHVLPPAPPFSGSVCSPPSLSPLAPPTARAPAPSGQHPLLLPPEPSMYLEEGHRRRPHDNPQALTQHPTATANTCSNPPPRTAPVLCHHLSPPPPASSPTLTPISRWFHLRTPSEPARKKKAASCRSDRHRSHARRVAQPVVEKLFQSRTPLSSHRTIIIRWSCLKCIHMQVSTKPNLT